MAEWRRACGWVAWPVLLAATAMALAGWLALRDPRFDRVNDILPFWFTGGAIAAILLIVVDRPSRRSRGRSGNPGAILCLVILAASGLPPLVREAGAAIASEGEGAADAPGRRLTLIQFNVLKNNPDPEAAAAWVLHERPDIVTMAETLGSNRVMLRRLHAAYPYQVSCLSRMRCSTVILSRLPPLASGGLARGDPENQGALSAAWARFQGGGGPFTVVAVHMVRPWPWGNQDSGRLQLATFLAGIDHRRTIVAGDFNLTPWTVAMQRQDLLFGLHRQTRFLPTWPAMLGGTATPAILPIDHIYTGDDWRLVAIRRGPRLGSDHLPVVTTLDDIAR
jgi:endonuclease/exonuclease/phosphatase (EEP) superfamily protein YafD